MKFEILQNGQVIDTKTLTEGQHKIGRLPDSAICLNSPKISKSHGLIVIRGDKAAIVDSGSSNGTFVNGIMVKKQRLDFGDVVSIGDFQLRLVREFRSRVGVSGGASGNLAEKLDFEEGAVPDSAPAPVVAATPLEKFQTFVDKKVLIPLYEVMKSVEWRTLLAVVLLSTLVTTVLLSSRPLFVWAIDLSQKEALLRAHTVLTQAVRENFRILQKGGDGTRMTVEAWESEKGFQELYIIDARTQNIVAPTKYFNKTINDKYAIAAIDKVLKEKRPQVTQERNDGTFVVAQPIPGIIREGGEGDTEPGPSAIVLGQFGATSSWIATLEPLVEALIFSVFLALLAYYLIFKMVTHPIVSLQEQLDTALKGEDIPIVSIAKFTELENLAQVINFSVSRLKQAGGASGNPVAGEDQESEDAFFIRTTQEFDVSVGDGLLVLDTSNKVRFVGRVLEELLGMKNQYAENQNISDCCKDPGFAGTAIELAERVKGTLGESQASNLDINGVNRNMTAVGHRSQSGDIRLILLCVKMGGG